MTCRRHPKRHFSTENICILDRISLNATLCVVYHQTSCGQCHHIDFIMSAMASQITSLTIVYSTIYSGADQRKHQSSASLAFVQGIHRWPLNSLHKGPVKRRMFPFDDVIMCANWLWGVQTKGIDIYINIQVYWRVLGLISFDQSNL